MVGVSRSQASPTSVGDSIDPRAERRNVTAGSAPARSGSPRAPTGLSQRNIGHLNLSRSYSEFTHLTRECAFEKPETGGTS